MAEELTQAASSPAEAADPFNGETPSLSEFIEFRKDGTLPERFKPAEAAPTDAPEETVEPAEGESPEDAPESEPEEKPQEPPQKPVSPAEKRIKQLLAEKKDLERRLAAQAPTDVKTESSTAPAAQQASQPQYTRTKPTPEGTNSEGKPYAAYEDYVEDLALWSGEQQLAKYQRQQAEQQAQSVLRSQLEDARARYEDADETIFPTAQAIAEANIPLVVKQVIQDSDVFVDLCYVIGSDPEELQKFIVLAAKNPRMAIGKVFEYERGTKEALSGESGQAPEKKKTQAPKPPTPVGGSSSRAFDVNDDSLSADDWFRKRNAQLEKRKT